MIRNCTKRNVGLRSRFSDILQRRFNDALRCRFNDVTRDVVLKCCFNVEEFILKFVKFSTFDAQLVFDVIQKSVDSTFPVDVRHFQMSVWSIVGQKCRFRQNYFLGFFIIFILTLKK